MTEPVIDPVPARRPTIREVARLAGVSHQTVSRHLRGDETVNAGAGRRIAEAIAQLDYRPSLAARAMRGRKTGRLALLLPSGTAISSLEILAGATTAAAEAGYVVEVVTLGGVVERRAERVLELADSGLFEGVVSLTPLPGLTARAVRTPLAVVPTYDEQMHSIGTLADASATVTLIETLAAQGHRDFLHLAGDYAHTSAVSRREVFGQTLERLGLNNHGVIECAWQGPPARRAVLDLPGSTPVTAVIAANDVMAASAVRGAVERGWRVPDDLSVTGWDDTPVGGAMLPSLTSVAVDHEYVGRRAVSHLLAVLTGTTAAEPDRPLTTVIWRESTGPRRAQTG
ncbi:LacI family DNA-binding transcriptional regulator [Kineosporia sp. J2-2]|uniref:LacI family DNA-binding transcriptional regulator n=1 Tax=Kineosporia corallincola TaxID=2835133 RepID=A0ABS5TAS5_9ACTN|nr:LacI family DNA-binding transcriptional regulator [Kineosporia corallincola]MBT0768166.1 LacI family DNA-binding transcriptional regulator [Kineosporia corallincola]